AVAATRGSGPALHQRSWRVFLMPCPPMPCHSFGETPVLVINAQASVVRAQRALACEPPLGGSLFRFVARMKFGEYSGALPGFYLASAGLRRLLMNKSAGSYQLTGG